MAGFNPIKNLQKRRLDKQWEKLNNQRNEMLEKPSSKDRSTFYANEEKRKNIEHQIKLIEKKIKKLK